MKFSLSLTLFSVILAAAAPVEKRGDVAYAALSENPAQIKDADGVDFLLPRITVYKKRSEADYPEHAENPTLVESADGVEVLLPRIAYKKRSKAVTV
ncbi:hypothetical protein GQ43DRAFT_479786 [Delitschia confertaspora ATCC 74209]|uniref:Uncharacterized protein n=1 Tax=Delitschia confertaspora ATCC 74209 TaxID=1513339 RepID=A0A9P4JNY2_9PLEO|nr:hypothetical protein GQ43DRAFT_479786 [Delitschia confertaspora ATCC 74209]